MANHNSCELANLFLPNKFPDHVGQIAVPLESQFMTTAPVPLI